MRNLVAIYILLLLSSCYTPKSGSNSPEVRTELDELASESLPMEEKYLVLARVITSLLDETAAMPQDAAAIVHLSEFVSDNESALTMLKIQISNWERNLTEEERMLFLMKLLSQPYATRIKGLSNGLKNRFSSQEAAKSNLGILMSTLEFRR